MKHKNPPIISILIAVAGLLIFFDGCTSEPEAPVLSIFCFQGYAEPEWVKPFEAAHGCKVRITYTNTIEEMFEKTAEAPEAFHLLSVDSGRVPLYRRAGLIQPIDETALENYDAISPFFRHHPFCRAADGRLLHVPIVWGTQTLTVNTDRVPETVLNRHLSPDRKSLSLDILTDPDLKGRTAFFDEAANVFAVAAIHEGVEDPHHFSASDWPRVEDRIRRWMRNAAEFTTGVDAEFNAVASGRVWVLLGGNDAILNLRLEKAGIRDRFAQYPAAEGTYCWIDGWIITRPTSGRILSLARAFIDMTISRKGQKMLVEQTGFGPVSAGGRTALPEAVSDSAYWYANDMEAFPAPLIIMAPEAAPKRRVEAWARLKSGMKRD